MAASKYCSLARLGGGSLRYIRDVSACHVYVHVPFCSRRCAYCDFSIAVRRAVPVDEYLSALTLEMARLDRTDVALDTLYFGGGTPSRLSGPGIVRAIDVVTQHFDLASGAEVTVEANPEDITDENVSDWISAGVNRLSIGVQTFDEDVLRWMHRVHTSDESKAAVETARRGGIRNLSIDLI